MAQISDGESGLSVRTKLNSFLTDLTGLVTPSAAILNLGGFGTGATNFCVGNDSRLTDSRNRKIFAYENTTQSHTGDTNETIKINFDIPAGTFKANSVLWFESQVGKTGVLNSGTFRAYLSPNNNSLTGATLIANQTLTALQLKSDFTYRFANKNSLSLNERWNTNGPNDYSEQNADYATTNIDTNVHLWFIVTLQNVNAADTTTLRNVQLYFNHP